MNTEPDHSPLLDGNEVVELLGITAEELAEARKQRVLRAEPFKQRWWQWRPRYRYRLKALWDFVCYREEVRKWFDGYRLPGERIFDKMVDTAIRLGASDIHFVQQPLKTFIRFRINGSLSRGTYAEPEHGPHLFSYLALVAERDPRDRNVLLGSCTTTDQPQEHWVRFSSVRAQYGMATTLRVLPPAAPASWGELGTVDAAQQSAATELIQSTQPGVTLFAAPQGEGMTTTLRYALYQANRPENDILIVDDVVDFPTGGITRVVRDRDNGMTPAVIVQTALRQGVSLLVFASINDAETAEAVLQAAGLGMRVWAGIRVPDFSMNATPEESAEVVYLRFAQWGLGKEQVQKQLRGTVMQRLLRCLCPHCKIPVPLSDSEALQIESHGIAAPEMVYKAGSCDICHRSGYSARTGVFAVYCASAVSAGTKIPTARQIMRHFAGGDTSLDEIKRLDVRGDQTYRNRIITNIEPVQKR